MATSKKKDVGQRIPTAEELKKFSIRELCELEKRIRIAKVR